MNTTIKADLAVIGAGSGGLSVAAGAAQMGADVVLVEKGEMGGDCLNYGCVPSKSLLAAAHTAQTIRSSGRFGVNGHEPDIRFNEVQEHVHDVIASIAPHDSVERFESLGVKVIRAPARFTSPREIEAGEFRIKAKRFVIATGSRAAIPPILGLTDVAVMTNENIFCLDERPEHLVIIGGGPIGIEMAQAHRRLGSKVTVLQGSEILNKDDRDAVAVIRKRIIEEGVDLREKVMIRNVERAGNAIAIVIGGADEEPVRIVGTHVLVAAGREPNVADLDLETAGVRYSPREVEVDARLRTTNKRIFAVGDVLSDYQFTHIAGYHAGIVIRNALFKLPAKVKYHAVPWVTYSDPELAHVGLGENEAHVSDGDAVRVLRWSFEDNDRARAEWATERFIKVNVGRRGRILGATIVGRNAGELILPWVLAIDRGLKIGAMANIIAPYPTLGEVSKRVAGSYYTNALFGPRTRRMVRFLQKIT